ncbi:sugar phosphate isomerase/epimerase [Pseudomonas sp. S5(2021)]|nr:sugar phosphate isomerase/epimerase [Pseudomonas sp. S5(2021)]
MRLSISNIAWDRQDDLAVAGMLRSFSIDAIDVAPGKYFPMPDQASDADISAVRDWWSSQGIEIIGMQSLLFGTTGMNLFGPRDVQDRMLQHLSHICRIGAGLGAGCLVFGSPKNRDRGRLTDEQALAMAVPFFQKLAQTAEGNGVVICLEPNPTNYGANFMTNSDETALVVEEVGHTHLRMQLDTGALTINSESAEELLKRHAALIGHIHASEPGLLPLGDGITDHSAMAAAIYRHLPTHPVTVEMLPGDKPTLQAIESALVLATKHYRTMDRSTVET